MDEIDYQALTAKISELTLKNKQLRRACTNKEGTIRHLRRVIKKLKEEAAKDRKPKYKNSKRGGRF